MFLNPPEPDVTIEESLHMGGRHTMFTVVDGVAYVTSIVVARLDPEPPIYQVVHTEFTEQAGVRDYRSNSTESFDDLDRALAHLVTIHPS